jgi:hypothetical protein
MQQPHAISKIPTADVGAVSIGTGITAFANFFFASNVVDECRMDVKRWPIVESTTEGL